MNITFNKGGVVNHKGNWNLIVEIPKDHWQHLDKIKEIIAVQKPKVMQIDIKRKKRSLNANKYLWSLIGKISSKLGTTSEELYLVLLQKYGKFTPMIIESAAVEEFKQGFKTAVEVGEFESRGKTWVNVNCYHGSSTYNSKEFSELLNGVVQDAKDLGIQTLDDKEINEMIKNWGSR